MKITIAEKEFPSKKALKECVREMIGAYQLGEKVSKEDRTFLLALLMRHHSHKTKIGEGVVAFWPRINDSGKRGWSFERVDGTIDWFSWIKCVSPPSTMARLKAGLRECIRSQKNKVKQEFLARPCDQQLCQVSGMRLDQVAREDIHVDHFPLTFDAIARSFIDTHLQGINIADITYKEAHGSGDTDGTWFSEDFYWLRNLFFEYHLAKTSYRIVHGPTHLRLKRA